MVKVQPVTQAEGSSPLPPLICGEIKTIAREYSLPGALLEQSLEQVRPRVLHGDEGIYGRRRGRRRDCRRLHHDLTRPKPLAKVNFGAVQKFGHEVAWGFRNLVSDYFIYCAASPLSRYFVWFSFQSSGYLLGCTVAAVSAQWPGEQIKTAL